MRYVTLCMRTKTYVTSIYLTVHATVCSEDTLRPRSHRTSFLQWEAPFLNCFLLAVSVLLCTLFMRPGHLAFSPPAAPRIFAGALWAPEVEKKATLSGKAPHVIAFFSIIQSHEWRGGPSVVVMKVYRCLESLETAIMDEKLVVSVTGFTRSCI